jgi:predicted kinase
MMPPARPTRVSARRLVRATCDDLSVSSPIYLIVGSASAGKSTAARALAASFEHGVHIPVDELRHMVVAGLALPAPGWGDELVRQISLARSTAIQMAVEYAAAGFAVAIDDFFDPLGLREYRALLTRPEAHGVVLYPAEAEVRRRNATRIGPADPSAEMAIGHAYGFMPPMLDGLVADGWLVLDTTTLDVAATVEAIRTAGGPR